MADNILKTLLHIIIKPETNMERIAHEALEFVVYGNIYKWLSEQVE